MLNLLDAINVDTSDSSHFCDREYYLWEDNIAKPALEALGYKDIVFADGERDSFGPLTRIVYAKKDDISIKFIYG